MTSNHGHRDDHVGRTCLGVGIDLISTDEVQGTIESLGQRYLERVYTEGERHRCGDDPQAFAQCFAAKEATMKAFADGSGQQLPWRSIELQVDAQNSPSVRLTGTASELARARGVASVAISLTRRRAGAAAVVLIEGRSTHE